MKKKILALCLVVVLAVTAVTGATLAYFTDTDEKVNTFTSGNVKIEQLEKDRDGDPFQDGQLLMPIVDDYKEDGYHMGANYIDKFVTVKNNGNQPAYIRTHLAFPAALDDGPSTFDAAANILHWNGASATDTFGAAQEGGEIDNDWYFGKSTSVDWPGNGGEWNFYQANVGGVVYNVYVATHGTAVPAGKTTAPNLMGVYLDKDVDYNADTSKYVDQNGNDIDFDLNTTKVLAFSEAVQAEGFDETDADVAFNALDEAFGEIGTYAPWTGATVVNNG